VKICGVLESREELPNCHITEMLESEFKQKCPSCGDASNRNRKSRQSFVAAWIKKQCPGIKGERIPFKTNKGRQFNVKICKR